MNKNQPYECIDGVVFRHRQQKDVNHLQPRMAHHSKNILQWTHPYHPL